MERKPYQTRQQMAVLECISKEKDGYVTVMDIARHLEALGYHVGRTTIYRHLERLEEQGMVHRLKMEGVSGTCYQYCGVHCSHEDHFFMKCESCGQLVHLDCEYLEELYRHVQQEHHIELNPHKTMFYGRCEQCRRG